MLTFQPIKANFVYEVLQNYPKIDEFCSWKMEPAVKAKMLTYVLPTEKRLIVSLWKFFATNAAFTLNGFDNQEWNVTFVKTDFQVLKLKFHACKFKQDFYPLPKLLSNLHV